LQTALTLRPARPQIAFDPRFALGTALPFEALCPALTLWSARPRRPVLALEAPKTRRTCGSALARHPWFTPLTLNAPQAAPDLQGQEYIGRGSEPGNLLGRGASFATVVGDSFAIFLTRSFTRILRMAINSTHAMCGVVGWRNLIANGRGLYGVSTGYARRVCFLMGGVVRDPARGKVGSDDAASPQLLVTGAQRLRLAEEAKHQAEYNRNDERSGNPDLQPRCGQAHVWHAPLMKAGDFDD
jgi:hypothetical protein